MNRKRSLWLLALLPLFGLVWATKSAASWRPRLFCVQPNADFPWLSNDGRLLAVGTAGNRSGFRTVDGFQIWDVETRQPLWKTRLHDCLLDRSPDSRVAVVAHAPHSLQGVMDSLVGVQFELRDLRSGQLLRVLERCDFAPNDLSLDYACTPDGTEFVLTTKFFVRRWSMATGKLLAVYKWAPPPHQKPNLTSTAFTPDHKQILGYEVGMGITVFDAHSGKRLRSMPQALVSTRMGTISFLSVSPDSYSFYEDSESSQGGQVFRLSDGRPLWRTTDIPTYTRDGKLAYVATGTGLDVCDAHTGRKLNHLGGPTHYGFDISPDGNWLYEARGGKIYYWRAR